MFVIGVTGGIGCGKSTVANICKQAGLPVVDADELSREVTASGGAAIPAIIEVFGEQVIDHDGSLNRAAMAKMVFKDHRALDQLSHLVHQHVLVAMRKQVNELAEKKVKAAILDVPIPVKEGFVDLCDQIWVVWADDDIRIRRLAKRGMPADESRRRMAMQMTKEEYIALADFVIDNNTSEDDLRQHVYALMEQELGQRGIRYKKETPPDEKATHNETNQQSISDIESE